MSVKQVDPVTNRLVRGTSFRRVSGTQETTQGVDVRLKKWRSEDPWNLEDGTDFLRLVFVKGTPLGLIIGELERRILSQPGMVTVDEPFDATLEGNAKDGQTLAVTWSGTASTSTPRELQRIAGRTEITS